MDLFQYSHEAWIQPELDKRFGATGIPEGFKVWEALIKLPANQPAIVEFNEEIGWEVETKPITPFKVGELVYLHDVEDVLYAKLPTVDGVKVSFVYVFWVGYSYSIIFDFTKDDPSIAQDANNDIGKLIANHLRSKMRETTVKLFKNTAPQLKRIGLWAIPSLMPYPMSKIIERIGAKDFQEARQLLVAHCNSKFILEKLIQTWQPVKVFNDRYPIYAQALLLHSQQSYIGSIEILVNQIEGVIVDWLHGLMPPEDVKWKTKSRVEQFYSVVKGIPEFEYVYREILESTIEFLNEGGTDAKPFQEFKSWLNKVDPNFPARHALSHGKYIPEIYTEENSIKLFLLLDTICLFMRLYEQRKSGKDNSQNAGSNPS